jgi:hypothetical protein
VGGAGSGAGEEGFPIGLIWVQPMMKATIKSKVPILDMFPLSVYVTNVGDITVLPIILQYDERRVVTHSGG